MYSLETLSAIDFELSSHCNSKCPQCPRYDTQGYVQKDLNITHLDFLNIKSLPLSKMPNLKEVSFCGNFGDPLMNPHLDQIIDFFDKQNITISTNASLRDEQWWINLAKKNNVEVTFCIDGIGDTHELYRRKTSYSKIIKNAKAFINSGGKAIWQYIIFRHNEHQIKEANRLSAELGFKKIKFMYSDRFDTDNTWKVYDNGKYQYNIEKASNQVTLRERLGEVDGKKYWNKLYQGKGKISCVWRDKKRLYIHSDGGVYPCCMLANITVGNQLEKILLKKIVHDFEKINIKNYSLEQILLSEAFLKNIPKSFRNDPFQHPICIEYCNQTNGRYKMSDIQKKNQIDIQ